MMSPPFEERLLRSILDPNATLFVFLARFQSGKEATLTPRQQGNLATVHSRLEIRSEREAGGKGTLVM
jgi:hypothetical protein